MSVYLNEGEFWESEKIKRVFSLENHMLCMCKVEGAIASAEAEMGMISERDAKKINDMVDAKNVDIKLYEEKMNYTGGHPIVSFLAAWRQSFGDDPAKDVVHYAAATADIADNVVLLKLQEVHEIILDDLYEMRSVLRELAQRYRDTPMAGRSHHQHATPMTFGCKVANWLMEVQRQIVRLQEAAKRLFVVSCYGAVGGMNTFGKRGMEFNRLVAKYLKMDWSPVSWQTSKDTVVEYLSDLVSITNTMGKIAMELYELSRTEVAEVAEPWTFGNVGSSTMPQKRNPWGLETMVAIARTCTSQITNAYACMSQFHERDFIVQYQGDFTIPAICNMCEHILHYGIEIIGKLDVYPERMLQNLAMTNGSIMLEHVMMVLTKKMSRFVAHEKLYEYAMKAYKEDVPVKKFIQEDPEIMAVITPEELNEAFDYMSYVGACPEEVDAALEICQ